MNKMVSIIVPIYNASLYCIGAGSNCPSSQYGALLTMPYRKPSGNTNPGYAGQIFIPNGDDKTTPDGLYYRTSMNDSWRGWKSVVHSSQKEYFSANNPNTAGYSGTKGDVYF